MAPANGDRSAGASCACSSEKVSPRTPVATCQLEFRHDGPHADLGQQSDEVEWWVRWTLTSSAVEQLTACAAVHEETGEHGEPAEEVVCLLFEGHPGRHSFDLGQI